MCMEGPGAERNFDRFAAHPVGARILQGAPSAFDLLSDHAALHRLPEGSLGRRFVEFMEREGISTAALDAAVSPVEEEVFKPSATTRRYLKHMRAMHDLWHVLTGYSRDLLGELMLLAFSHVQLRTRALGWIVRWGRFGIDRGLPGAGGRELLDAAAARAEHVEWLPTVDWEPLLERPLAEVRETLGLGAPPAYTRYSRAPGSSRALPDLAGDRAAP